MSLRLDLNLLVLFDSIYGTRNLTATGLQLGLSQPAVSRGLARLRDAYGDALFVRQPRGVQPTPLADGLAAPVAQALALLRGTMEHSSFDATRDQRAFTVAMSDIGERYFLPRLIAHLARRAPGVTLRAVATPQPGLLDSLASGAIDLAVGFLPATGKQLHSEGLFHERFVYIARQGHPQVRGHLSREQLRQLEHVIACPPGTQHAAAVEKVLTAPRLRATISLRVHSFLSIGPIVADSDLIAPIPSNLAALLAGHLNLQRVASPVAIPGFDVSMAWHPRFHRDAGGQWLRATFGELFAR